MARREVLGKEQFLEGNRQKWMGVLILCMFVLRLSNPPDIRPYLDFLTFIGVAGIFGMSWSANNKEKAETALRENTNERRDSS